MKINQINIHNHYNNAGTNMYALKNSNISFNGYKNACKYGSSSGLIGATAVTVPLVSAGQAFLGLLLLVLIASGGALLGNHIKDKA